MMYIKIMIIIIQIILLILQIQTERSGFLVPILLLTVLQFILN